MIEYEIETWESGGFVRDSLVHAFGCLGEAMVRLALQDPAIRRQCTNASVRVRDEQGRTRSLVDVGLGGGQTTLWRGEFPDEFALRYTHQDFRGALAIGFHLESGRLLGVAISEFAGNALSGAQWARTVTRRLHERHSQPPVVFTTSSASH
ncbi:MAG: hypothetical protein JKY37_25285 [Nannocystaceae bacterium]|nr:hypothetical protein [Nannocystaceae bacterium]